MIYTFLDSITMLYNMHNIISAVMILISMLTTKTTNVFHALIFFSIGWIFITIFTFDREILPSYFYFGFSYVESDKDSQITLQKSSLICIWILNVYCYSVQTLTFLYFHHTIRNIYFTGNFCHSPNNAKKCRL